MTRRSKREIERRLDAIDDVEQCLSLCELLNHDLKTVDEDRGIVRIVETGELRKRGTGNGSLARVIERTATPLDVPNDRARGGE
ncbi:hypothetical protein [Halarchaeum nitratireducens]|uniref:Uncharacterized protein n=1 Tax=Halarchaeum nitratireducens TaxID=489913 RepID=A0A830GF39_9EURY|nr:hypothetical protein [Halarchaeum nitratireducens]GGN26919.1 hypothetical protein GCM10009021_31760 [Halarchaeum nitratireducens]